MHGTENQIVVYQPNEVVRLDVRLENETVWLTQAQLCELFGVVKSNTSYHLKGIFAANELDYEATVQKIRTVRLEAGRNALWDIANCDRFKMRKRSSSRRCGVWDAMRQVHEDRLRNLPRPLHHRRPEGNLLDGRVAEGRGATDLRRRENGRGGHSGASRIDPQGDGGTAGIRQRGK